MLKEKIGGGIKRFFTETFRAHTKEEYADFFVRKGEGDYRTYPFIWLRVLALEIMIFAVVLIVSEFTGYDTFWSYAVLTGGLILNIPVFIFVYELYPYRDASFLKYFLSFFIGGVSAIALTLLAYYAYRPDNEWLSALWTGFVEEFFKVVPIIIALLAFKNKNPLFGFLIGAAVGAGVSVIEDMYYIHYRAGAWGFWGNDWRQLIEISLGRGLTAGCTHTLWSALIGWAFCKFKKPLINFRFYAVAVSCMALHFLWDLPLEAWWASELIYLGCAAVGFAVAAVLLHKERKKVFSGGEVQSEQLVVEEVAVADAVAAKSCAFGLSHIANIVAALCLSVIAIFTIGVCYSDWGFRSTKDIYFESIEELNNYVQSGMQFDIDWERAYDDSVENYAYSYEDGKLISATQIVEDKENGIKYYYNYTAGEEGVMKFNHVYMFVGDVMYRQVTSYEANGDILIYHTNFNPLIWYDEDKEQYYATVDCDEYYYGLVGTVAVASVMGVVLIGGIAAFTTLKIKARRQDNVG